MYYSQFGNNTCTVIGNNTCTVIGNNTCTVIGNNTCTVIGNNTFTVIKHRREDSQNINKSLHDNFLLKVGSYHGILQIPTPKK
jgi:cyanophycinase-like exopeptidase